MENKRKIYEVLEENISPDNIVRISELLALGALKYMCGHKMLHGMYADLARDIANKDAEGYVLTESYDIVQEAAMFLCGYMGMTVNDIKDGEQCTVRRLCNKTLCHKIYELWKVKRYTERRAWTLCREAESRLRNSDVRKKQTTPSMTNSWQNSVLRNARKRPSSVMRQG